MTKFVQNEIRIYKSYRWCTFLSRTQEAHDNRGNAFWSHLSKIYKPKSLHISKLTTSSGIISEHKNITDTLYHYYKEQAKEPNVNDKNPHD